jgi:hypothetical protein
MIVDVDAGGVWDESRYRKQVDVCRTLSFDLCIVVAYSSPPLRK